MKRRRNTHVKGLGMEPYNCFEGAHKAERGPLAKDRNM